MNLQERLEITKISKEFASGMGEFANNSVLLTDPLSAYLSSIGYDNKLMQVHNPETKEPILVIEFRDGDRFIPSGSQLKSITEQAKDFMWI